MSEFKAKINELNKSLEADNYNTSDLLNRTIVRFSIEHDLPQTLFRDEAGFSMGDSTWEDIEPLVENGLILYNKKEHDFDFENLDNLFLEEYEKQVNKIKNSYLLENINSGAKDDLITAIDKKFNSKVEIEEYIHEKDNEKYYFVKNINGLAPNKIQDDSTISLVNDINDFIIEWRKQNEELVKNNILYNNLKDLTMAEELKTQETAQEQESKLSPGSLEYLENQLHYTGFSLSEEQKKELAVKLEAGKDFNMNLEHTYKESNGRTMMSYDLHFQKSESNQKMYFNNYTATSNHQIASKLEDAEAEEFKGEYKQGHIRSQKFPISSNGKYNITQKEAYNLLAGRAVNTWLPDKQFVEDEKGNISQEVVPKNAWIKLADGTAKSENGNYPSMIMSDMQHFHPAVALDKYLANTQEQLARPEEKQKIVGALKRGDRFFVDLISKNGKEMKMGLEANPLYKSIEAYDFGGNKQFVESPEQKEKRLEKKTQAETPKQGVTPLALQPRMQTNEQPRGMKM